MRSEPREEQSANPVGDVLRSVGGERARPVRIGLHLDELRASIRLSPDRLLGLGVEELQAVGGDGEVDSFAGAQRESGVDARDSVSHDTGASEMAAAISRMRASATASGVLEV